MSEVNLNFNIVLHLLHNVGERSVATVCVHRHCK
jgi:hypothetical protein